MSVTTVDATSVPRRNDDDVAEALFETEAVLYHLGRSQVYLLNGTASVVWQLCDGTASIEELARDLSEGFGADLDEVRTGVLSVIEDLASDDLLRV